MNIESKVVVFGRSVRVLWVLLGIGTCCAVILALVTPKEWAGQISEKTRILILFYVVAIQIFIGYRMTMRVRGDVIWLRDATFARLNRLEALQIGTGLPAQAEVASAWPWGNHSSKALGDLEAAGRMFWSHFDPVDESTAPTNEMVIDWLVDKRGCSKDKARSIASILRADGLTPGPRR